ncbi:MAG: hypothetical protein IT556_07340, partial [Acetobacteraceae bacterium]|nr:hypothetical protein [Acetobacteraceae bacterium]
TQWHFRSSTDTLAQITAANYFASASDMLARNDVLILAGSDGVRQSRVVSVTPGAVTLGPLVA